MDIRELTLPQLEEELATAGFPKYRARQVHHWVWKQQVSAFSMMQNVPKKVRHYLQERYVFHDITTEQIQKSTDGTIKFRLKLYDEAMIEAVLIPVPDDKRFTICVSSQVGCSLSCSFCATGTMGLKRNLKAHEIIQQYWIVQKKCQEVYDSDLTNVVFMGMGEPLLNYSQVIQAIRWMNDEDILGMSPRRITISTAGIAKMIIKLADEGLKINLALSLHAANDEKRNSIMAINQSNSLESLLEAIHYFYRQLYTKISYEYIALKNFNDGIEDADQLAQLTHRFPVMVNIIEYNTVSVFDWEKTEEDQLNAFARQLRSHGVMVTVRRSRGKDIDAACGQLAIENE